MRWTLYLFLLSSFLLHSGLGFGGVGTINGRVKCPTGQVEEKDLALDLERIDSPILEKNGFTVLEVQDPASRAALTRYKNQISELDPSIAAHKAKIKEILTDMSSIYEDSARKEVARI